MHSETKQAIRIKLAILVGNLLRYQHLLICFASPFYESNTERTNFRIICVCFTFVKCAQVVIVEDLTKDVYTLFLRASDHPGVMRAGTAEGKVFLQDISLLFSERAQ